MPSVASGEREKLAGEVDGGQLWTVEVTGAPVRLATRKNRADDGTLIRNGDLFFVGVPEGSALWAYGDGSGAADVALDAVAGDFPAQSGTLYVEPLLRSQVSGTIRADVTDRADRELGLVDVEHNMVDGLSVRLSDAIQRLGDDGMLFVGGIEAGTSGVPDPAPLGIVPMDYGGDNEPALLTSTAAAMQGTAESTAGTQIRVDVENFNADALSTKERTLPGLQTGQETIGTSGTSVQFNDGIALEVPGGSAVKVSAPAGNSGAVYIGDDTVDASTGYVLDPGKSEEFPVSNVQQLYADADSGGDSVSWAVVGA